MNFKPILFGIIALTISATYIPVQAQDPSPMFATKSLTPEAALKVAQATLKACSAKSFQVAVAVVDRGGHMQVMLRDRFAGPHTPETARRKAWTALSFRTNTTQMSNFTQPGEAASGTRHIRDALMLGGGVMIRAGGQLVGAVGVSGAPSGQADEDCAVKGIGSIQDELDF